MTPALLSDDDMNGCLANIEVATDLMLVPSPKRIEVPDRRHLYRREDANGVIFPPDIVAKDESGVVDVPLLRRVFQIAWQIIAAVPVLVVHDMAERARANKRLRHKAVNKRRLRFLRSGAESDALVSGNDVRYERLYCSAVNATTRPAAASHSAMVGDLIESFPTNHVLPNFFAHVGSWLKASGRVKAPSPCQEGFSGDQPYGAGGILA